MLEKCAQSQKLHVWLDPGIRGGGGGVGGGGGGGWGGGGPPGNSAQDSCALSPGQSVSLVKHSVLMLLRCSRVFLHLGTRLSS